MIETIHRASMELLLDPGVEVWTGEAAELFRSGGAEVFRRGENGPWQVKIPEKTVMEALPRRPRSLPDVR